MATKYLINTVRVGTSTRYAGSSFDTTNDADEIAAIEASGGVLLVSTASLVAAAAVAEKLRKAGAPPEEISFAMIAGAVASTGTGAVPTTRTLTAGAGLTGGGDLSADRTVDVGAGAGITVSANAVATTFGLVGEMAAAGVSSANAVGSVDKSARVDHAHAHGAQALGDGTNHAVATSSFAGFMSAADKAKSDAGQVGTGTLVGGTVTISGVTLTVNSRIQVTMKDPGAGAITGFASLHVPNAARVVGAGTGSFDVTAIDDAKAQIATAVCTFDWRID